MIAGWSMIGIHENPTRRVGQQATVTPTPSVEGKTRLTSIVDELGVLAVVVHVEVQKPIDGEDARGGGAQQNEPLARQCQSPGLVMRESGSTHDDDSDKVLLLLGPAVPVPYLSQQDAEHDQVEHVSDTAQQSRPASVNVLISPHDERPEAGTDI